jgi:hypothetical protein
MAIDVMIKRRVKPGRQAAYPTSSSPCHVSARLYLRDDAMQSGTPGRMSGDQQMEVD